MNTHKTTMTSEQRKELIRVLMFKQPKNYIEKLAELTDFELHLQWLCECRYADVKSPIPLKEKFLFDYEN